jgi:hypothetical protein
VVPRPHDRADADRRLFAGAAPAPRGSGGIRAARRARRGSPPGASLSPPRGDGPGPRSTMREHAGCVGAILAVARADDALLFWAYPHDRIGLHDRSKRR